MKVITFPRYRVEIKRDQELSDEETNQIIKLYNLSFYDNQVVRPDQLDFLNCCVRRMDIFYWFLVKNSKDNILAMVSLVHNFERAYMFDVNEKLGENICSLAVHPNARGHGLARHLLKLVEAHAKNYCGLRENDPLVLELKNDSHHHQQLGYLYTTEGFQKFAETDNGIFFKKRS